VDNIFTKEGATLAEIYRANNTYLNVAAEINEMQSALATDLETHIWRVNNKVKKALKDASGSSNTPASRVFFSDSEGAASSDSVFIYDSINKKLGIGVSPAIGTKLHLHQASTANALIKLSNTTTGSGEHDGLNIGVVGNSYVVRTQYDRPIVIETENPSEPGQYLEIAKFQKTGSVSNTILNSDLKVNTIVAKSTAASVYLTHENNTIKTRTATQVRADIGAQPSNSNLTTIAGLTHSNRHVMVSNGSSWTRRALEEADLPSLSAAKITSGTLDNARLSFNPDYFVQGTNNRRVVLSNSTSPLASKEYSTFFRMDNTDPSFDSRLTGGVGLGLKVINNSTPYSFELMSNGNGVILFGGTDHAGNRYPWKEIYHTGNFDPSTKANATHGHAWGEITDKPSAFTPSAHSHAIADVTDLQTVLNNKQSTISAGTTGQFYAWDKTMKAVDWAYVANKPTTFYTHPTGDGNLHVPATGTTNNKKVLTAGSTAGSLNWSFVDWADLLNKPSSFTPSAHTHPWSGITDKPASIAYKNEFNVFTAPSGISIDDVTAEDDGTSTTNWNVVSHMQLVSGNNKMAFFLGSPQNERKAFIQVGHTNSAYASYLGELRLNPFGGNVTVNGYSVWHSGNFNPDNYQPAITGTANKVLSIQSDGSGVKTGCLRDLGAYAAVDNAERFAIIHSTDQAAISLQSKSSNRFWISSAPSVLNIGGTGDTVPENGQLQIYYNSRVVIPSLPLLVGKTTATGGYRLEVEGDTLVNGKTSTNKLNTGAFVRKTLTTSYTIIDLNNESSWNFRIKTALTNSPAIFFGNAQEGDEVWVFNVYNSQPIVVMVNFNSGYEGMSVTPNTGMRLKCVGESRVGSANYPAFVYDYIYATSGLELEP
jgi:hypothetical protein